MKFGVWQDLEENQLNSGAALDQGGGDSGIFFHNNSWILTKKKTGMFDLAENKMFILFEYYYYGLSLLFLLYLLLTYLTTYLFINGGSL